MTVSRLVLLSAACLAGCAAPPLGPLVQVLPAPNKSYAQFTSEDNYCRASAEYRVSGQAQYANDRAVGVGLLTTVAGTALGAVIGGGRGAAVGAVTGGGIGIGLGAGTSAGAQGGIQARYDGIYAQCMYAYGNQVPGAPPIAPVIAYQPAPRPAPSLYAGSIVNPLVRDIQRQLRRHGYFPGQTTGIETPETTQAIQSFQASHGLPPDGVASGELLGVLRNTPPGA